MKLKIKKEFNKEKNLNQKNLIAIVKSTERESWKEPYMGVKRTRNRD